MFQIVNFINESQSKKTIKRLWVVVSLKLKFQMHIILGYN